MHDQEVRSNLYYFRVWPLLKLPKLSWTPRVGIRVGRLRARHFEVLWVQQKNWDIPRLGVYPGVSSDSNLWLDFASRFIAEMFIIWLTTGGVGCGRVPALVSHTWHYHKARMWVVSLKLLLWVMPPQSWMLRVTLYIWF